MSNQNQKQTRDIMKQLGPLTETNMKIKLPRAFVDYINENTTTEIGYCSEEVVLSMIAHLDGGEDITLKNYTILELLHIEIRRLWTRIWERIGESYNSNLSSA